MEHEKIQFPESYTNALSPEEAEGLATAVGVKFRLHNKYYDGAFADICPVVCRIVRDNMDKIQITEAMQWEGIENAAEFTDNESLFRQDLLDLSGDYEVEALCSISLAKNGILKDSIAEKVGKMIRNLINENHIRNSWIG